MSGGRPARHSDRDSQYLLTSFARCALCGGALAVLNRTTYGCLSYHKRGGDVCRNALRVSMPRIDDAVLAKFDAEILQPKVARALVAEVRAAFEPATRAKDVTRMRADVARLDRELARLTDAIATGGQLAPLLDALKERQAHRTSLVAALTSADVLDGARHDWKRIEADALTEIRRWRTLLTDGVAGGRQFCGKCWCRP